MKDSIKEQLQEATDYDQVKSIVDEYIGYYNNDRYQWHLAKLSPNEYYQFCITGEYPLKVSNPPKPPIVEKDSSELGRGSKQKQETAGAGTESRDSTLDAQRPGSP